MKLGKFVTASVAVAIAGAGLFAVRAFGADEVKGVRKGCETFVAAFNKHDVKGMAGVFTADADMVNAEGKLVTGRDAIEKELAAWHTGNGPMREASVEVKDEPFRLLSPDVAITDADVVVTGAYGPDGAKAGPVGLLVTNVWKKTGDNWLVTACRMRMKSPSPGSTPPK